MRRHRPGGLRALSVVVLGVGVVHVAWLFIEHLQHPEWSAPASANLVYLAPYVMAAGTLYGLSCVFSPRTVPGP